MKNLSAFLIIAIAVLAVSCSSSVELSSNYNKTSDFGNFKTFAFAKPSQGDMHFFSEKYPKIVNEQNLARLEESIIKEMEARGYTQSNNPDLTVSFFIQLQTNTAIQSSHISNGSTPGYYGYYSGWGGIGGVNIGTQDYRTGGLVVNVVDNKSNNLVWYGAASGLMKANPSKAYQNIPIRIAQIFSDYYWKAGQTEPVSPIPVQ